MVLQSMCYICGRLIPCCYGEAEVKQKRRRVFKNVVAQFIGQMRLMNQATTEIINREELTNIPNPEVGQQLYGSQTDGTTITGTITNVTNTTITVDFNDPLAGKNLTFEITLISIQ